MEYGWEFFWSIIASSAGTTFLLGGIGWLLRGQISHWLNKDLEVAKAQHQRELQREKVDFERQLEAYKVTLIAEAERARAAQSVRTAGALKIMDLKFEALRNLSSCIRDLTSSGIAQCAAQFSHLETAVKYQTRMSDHLDTSSTAIEGVAPFLPHESYRAFLDLHYAVLQAVAERGQQLNPLSEERVAALRESLIPLQVNANSVLRAQILEMMQVA